jgi:hypothetical protein
MADQTGVSSSILHCIIQAGITKMVGDEMGGVSRKLSELTKGMAPDDAKEARLMLLECMREGFEIFCMNTQQKIENPSGKKFEVTSRTDRS